MVWRDAVAMAITQSAAVMISTVTESAASGLGVHPFGEPEDATIGAAESEADERGIGDDERDEERPRLADDEHDDGGADRRGGVEEEAAAEVLDRYVAVGLQVQPQVDDAADQGADGDQDAQQTGVLNLMASP